MDDTQQSLVDRLLMTEAFEFEVKTPPHDCAQHLWKLEQPSKGFWGISSRKAVIKEEGNGVYDFDIRMMKSSRGSDYTSVKAVGRIELRNGKTLIRGQIKFGWVYALAVVSTVVVFFAIMFGDLSESRPSNLLLFNVVVGAIAAYYLWTLFSDKSKLKQLIYSTLQSAS